MAVRSIDGGICINGEMGKMVATILPALAEAERRRILDRANDGRLESVWFGRKRSVSNSMVLAAHRRGIGATEIAWQLNIAHTNNKLTPTKQGNNIITSHLEGVICMSYSKPVVLAKSSTYKAECRPNSKPSGRPCKPPGPSGR